jgi:putative redox protein
MANITVESLGNYRMLVSTGAHALVGDEPKGIGEGLGPDPYELLLGALGSCTSMTVLMYARRKGWPLRRVKAELSFGRVHARDCENCEQSDEMIDEIRVRLHLEGDLDAAQRARIAEIATRCPVRKTLLGRPQIIDEVVEGV